MSRPPTLLDFFRSKKEVPDLSASVSAGSSSSALHNPPGPNPPPPPPPPRLPPAPVAAAAAAADVDLDLPPPLGTLAPDVLAVPPANAKPLLKRKTASFSSSPSALSPQQASLLSSLRAISLGRRCGSSSSRLCIASPTVRSRSLHWLVSFHTVPLPIHPPPAAPSDNSRPPRPLPPVLPRHSVHSISITALSFDESGTLLAVGDQVGGLRVYDVKELEDLSRKRWNNLSEERRVKKLAKGGAPRHNPPVPPSFTPLLHVLTHTSQTPISSICWHPTLPNPQPSPSSPDFSTVLAVSFSNDPSIHLFDILSLPRISVPAYDDPYYPNPPHVPLPRRDVSTLVPQLSAPNFRRLSAQPSHLPPSSSAGNHAPPLRGFLQLFIVGGSASSDGGQACDLGAVFALDSGGRVACWEVLGGRTSFRGSSGAAPLKPKWVLNVLGGVGKNPRVLVETVEKAAISEGKLRKEAYNKARDGQALSTTNANSTAAAAVSSIPLTLTSFTPVFVDSGVGFKAKEVDGEATSDPTSPTLHLLVATSHSQLLLVSVPRASATAAAGGVKANVMGAALSLGGGTAEKRENVATSCYGGGFGSDPVIVRSWDVGDVARSWWEGQRQLESSANAEWVRSEEAKKEALMTSSDLSDDDIVDDDDDDDDDNDNNHTKKQHVKSGGDNTDDDLPLDSLLSSDAHGLDNNRVVIKRAKMSVAQKPAVARHNPNVVVFPKQRSAPTAPNNAASFSICSLLVALDSNRDPSARNVLPPASRAFSQKRPSSFGTKHVRQVDVPQIATRTSGGFVFFLDLSYTEVLEIIPSLVSQNPPPTKFSVASTSHPKVTPPLVVRYTCDPGRVVSGHIHSRTHSLPTAALSPLNRFGGTKGGLLPLFSPFVVSGPTALAEGSSTARGRSAVGRSGRYAGGALLSLDVVAPLSLTGSGRAAGEVDWSGTSFVAEDEESAARRRQAEVANDIEEGGCVLLSCIGARRLRRIALLEAAEGEKGSHGFFSERILAASGNGDFIVVAEGGGVDILAV